MKAAFVSVVAATTLMLLFLGWTSEAVQVEENGESFSLEAVKRLQELMEGQVLQNPRVRAGSASFCEDPLLPQEFFQLCKTKGAYASLSRLALVPLDMCEICAFAACTGC